MPRPEVLEELKTAEGTAAEIIASAESDATQVVADARKTAEDIRSAAEAEAAELRRERLEAAREEIATETAAIIAAGEADREETVAAARGELDEAVDSVLERFERVVNDQT